MIYFFFFKQKTAYELRISDWSSDVCSSDLLGKIVAGGQRVQGPGYFVRPTIVRDLPGSARLVRDEQFGPVVPVLCYAELADAITRINASEHRLGSSVWSSDPYRAYLEIGRESCRERVWQ